MNCHDNKSHSKHILMMILCCGIPMILLFILSLIRFGIPEIRNTLSIIIPFMCPLMMIAMIPMMLIGKNKSCCNNDDNTKET